MRILSLFFVLIVAACQEPKTQKEKVIQPPPPDSSETTIEPEVTDSEGDDTVADAEELVLFERLMFLQSSTGRLGTVDDIHTAPTIRTEVEFSSSSGNNATPCIAPAKIKVFMNHIFIVCSLVNEVHILNLESKKTVKILTTGVDTNPADIAFVHDQLAFISASTSDEVLVFNPKAFLEGNSQGIETRITLKGLDLEKDPGAKPNPWPAALTLRGDKLYVALSQLYNWKAAGPGYVAVIDTTTLMLTQTVKLQGRNAVGFIKSPATLHDKLFVVTAGDYQNGVGFVGNGRVDEIDVNTESHVRSIEVMSSPMGGALASDGRIYLTNAKESKLVHLNVFDESPQVETIDLNSVCPSAAKSSMQFVSSALVDSLYIYLTEFNRGCFFMLKRSNLEVAFEVVVGSGPVGLVNY